VDEVGGDDLVLGVAKDVLHVGLGSLLQGGLDLSQRGVLDGLEGQVDDRNGRGRHAESHASELALDLGEDERDGLGGAGRGRDDVLSGGTATLPVLAGRAIHGLLGRGVAVDRGHQTFGEAEAFLQEDVDQRSQAVRGAGRVGNDVVLGGIVLVVVDAEDDGDVLTLRRSGDDDLLGASHDVTLGLLGIGEEAGGLDDELNTELGPGQFSRALGADDEDVLAVDDENVVVSLVGGGLLRGNGAVEATLGRVVLQEVGQIVGRDDVAHRDDVERRAEEALLNEGAEYEATDAAETIDCDFNCHFSLRF